MNKEKSFKDKFILFWVTGFGTGYSPIAPGTTGTVSGIIIFMILGFYPYTEYKFLQLLIYLLVTTLLLVFGIRWSTIAERDYFKKKDAGQIVIDEMVGYLVTMAGCLGSFHSGHVYTTPLLYIIIGFFVFRFFDIIKVYPGKMIEKWEGGTGIMFDDVVAGLYGFVTIQLLQLAVNEFDMIEYVVWFDRIIYDFLGLTL